MSRRPPFFFLITLCVIFALGLVMVFDITAAEVLDRSLSRSTHYAFLKQILYAVIGVGMGGAVWFVGYHNLIKWSRFFLFAGMALLVLVFIPGIGQQINGARRWIGIAGNSFQPSEFIKYIIPLYFIHVIGPKEALLTGKRFLLLLSPIAVCIGLILLEPDNGTVAIILAALVVLCLLTRIRWSYWALPLFSLLLVGGAVASRMPHVSDRIKIYLHPELDLKGKGHQPYQAKIAAGSGKLFGKGVGESLQKFDYLPEARSDYIAAIYAEEFGFVGVLFLIFLYMLLAFLGFYIAHQAVDTQGFYLAATVTFLICFQAFLNLGVVSGLLPSKGTNLPFFSHGGSSLLANCVAAALILNVSFAGKKTAEGKKDGTS